MAKEKLVIVGEYNEYGYTVMSTAGVVFYEAGNHLYDSAPSQSVPLGSCRAASLRQIRSWCIKMSMEIAEEEKAIYGGVERKDASAVS